MSDSVEMNKNIASKEELDLKNTFLKLRGPYVVDALQLLKASKFYDGEDFWKRVGHDDVNFFEKCMLNNDSNINARKYYNGMNEFMLMFLDFKDISDEFKKECITKKSAAFDGRSFIEVYWMLSVESKLGAQEKSSAYHYPKMYNTDNEVFLKMFDYCSVSDFTFKDKVGDYTGEGVMNDAEHFKPIYEKLSEIIKNTKNVNNDEWLDIFWVPNIQALIDRGGSLDDKIKFRNDEIPVWKWLAIIMSEGMNYGYNSFFKKTQTRVGEIKKLLEQVADSDVVKAKEINKIKEESWPWHNKLMAPDKRTKSGYVRMVENEFRNGTKSDSGYGALEVGLIRRGDLSSSIKSSLINNKNYKSIFNDKDKNGLTIFGRLFINGDFSVMADLISCYGVYENDDDSSYKGVTYGFEDIGYWNYEIENNAELMASWADRMSGKYGSYETFVSKIHSNWRNSNSPDLKKTNSAEFWWGGERQQTAHAEKLMKHINDYVTNKKNVRFYDIERIIRQCNLSWKWPATTKGINDKLLTALRLATEIIARPESRYNKNAHTERDDDDKIWSLKYYGQSDMEKINDKPVFQSIGALISAPDYEDELWSFCNMADIIKKYHEFSLNEQIGSPTRKFYGKILDMSGWLKEVERFEMKKIADEASGYGVGLGSKKPRIF